MYESHDLRCVQIAEVNVASSPLNWSAYYPGIVLEHYQTFLGCTSVLMSKPTHAHNTLCDLSATKT